MEAVPQRAIAHTPSLLYVARTEREQKLTAINFRFDLFAEIWMERYNELKAYRKHHGDCLVPHTFASNPQLGIWVGEQRYNSRTFKERRACAMTPERLALLEKLDFVWFVPDVIWNERYGELEEHVRFNGRGSLPTLKDNTRLRHWVANQQKLHRKIMNGEENALTEDRIRKLNKLGHLL
jgi:lambda repressor-like predicted transcriptional regulator